MSTLQISLLVIGALVVLAVYLFNVVQERRIRRRIESQFGKHDDVLLGEGGGKSGPRVEPSLKGVERGATRGATGVSAPAAAAGAKGAAAAGKAAGSDARAKSASATTDAAAVVAPRPGAAAVASAGSARPAATSRSPAASAGAAPAAAATATTAAAAATPAAAGATTSAAARQPAIPGAAVDGGAPVDGPDVDTELVILLRPKMPVSTASLRAETRGDVGKAVRWFGRVNGERWLAVADTPPREVDEIAACLMLVDRDGPVSAPQLQTFSRMISDVASSLAAQATLPPPEPILERAKSLDRVCAELDVQIGLNLERAEGAQPPTIAGTKLRGVAEAAGFRLSGRGQFEYYDENGAGPLFVLQEQRGQPLTADTLRSTQIGALTMVLDVPRTPDAVRAFDQMRAAAKRLATTLEASLVDDNRRALTDQALATIRTQVQETVAAMRGNQIEPGSPRALRLFE